MASSVSSLSPSDIRSLASLIETKLAQEINLIGYRMLH